IPVRTRVAAAAMAVAAASVRANRRERTCCIAGAASKQRQEAARAPTVRRLVLATRLTTKVPWLCVPASRRVCLFQFEYPSLQVSADRRRSFREIPRSGVGTAGARGLLQLS